MHFNTTMWRRIDEAKAGSPDAIAAILRMYRPPLLAYLESRGFSEHDAEDIVQHVSLEICQQEFLQKADRAKGRFRTLLLRVTQYISTSYLRQQSSQKRGGGRRAISLEDIQDLAVSPVEEESFNRLWVKSLVKTALERMKQDSTSLKVPYHEVLAMRFLEDKTTQEIAQKLQCKPHDVENYVYQGKERLRKHLHFLALESSSSQEEHDEETRLLVRYGL